MNLLLSYDVIESIVKLHTVYLPIHIKSSSTAIICCDLHLIFASSSCS